MKRTLIAILTVTLATAALAAPGARPQAGPGGPQGQRGPGRQFLSPQLVGEFLHLSDAQETQARALHESLRATIEPLREKLRTNREAVKDAVAAGNAQLAGQLLVAGKATRDQIKAARETQAAQFEAILTAEQKAKWAVVKELMELKHEQRHDRDDD